MKKRKEVAEGFNQQLNGARTLALMKGEADYKTSMNCAIKKSSHFYKWLHKED